MVHGHSQEDAFRFRGANCVTQKLAVVSLGSLGPGTIQRRQAVFSDYHRSLHNHHDDEEAARNLFLCSHRSHPHFL
jgi:hypothetical protein